MIYDAIVVGAGVEGSATAYQLAKRGRRVLLLEQFKLGHKRGSSHGLTRVTRKAYGSLDFFTVMMDDAYRQTDKLQTECGEQLFYNVGCMIVGKKGEDYLESTEVSLKRHNVPYEKFGHAEARARFPNMKFPENFEYIIDKTGGVLRADRVLRAFQVGMKNHSGEIRDEEEMIDLYHGGDIVTVKTNKGLHKTRSLILTLGPWASKWLPRIGVHIPIQTVKVLVCYWKEKIPGEFDYKNFPGFADLTTGVTKLNLHVYGLPSHERPGYVKAVKVLVCYWKEKMPGEFDHKKFPGFADRTTGLTKLNLRVYGLPSHERPGYVKTCLHGGPQVDPDRSRDVDVDWMLEALSCYVRKHFPTLEDSPSYVEECFYTNTPDTVYVLDTHPVWKNVIIGTGFSGQGFKLAPVVGYILADLAEGKQPKYDMNHFKMDRFFKHKL